MIHTPCAVVPTFFPNVLHDYIMQEFCLAIFLDELLKGFYHLFDVADLVIGVIAPETFYLIFDVLQPTCHTFFVLHDYIMQEFCLSNIYND